NGSSCIASKYLHYGGTKRLLRPVWYYLRMPNAYTFVFIMNIEQKLKAIENAGDLPGVLHFLHEEQEKDVNIYLRVLFLLLDFLVDSQYSKEEHDYYAAEIVRIYREAKSEYPYNCDFLFFGAMMIYIADVYFDETTDDADNMLIKANELCPNNALYQWGMYVIVDNRAYIETKK